MSFLANVFNVMIASPSDVIEEREIVRKVIHEWNSINSQSKHIVLLPVAWDTHSSPEMGEEPQTIINRDVLANSDMLVAIFEARIGTPTQQYESGTIEEIKRFIKQDKLAMVYFSEKPVNRNVDRTQLDNLEKFKSECNEIGLYSTFSSTGHFEKQFANHLQLKVISNKLFSSTPDVNTPYTATRKKLLNETASYILNQCVNSEDYIKIISFLSGKSIVIGNENLNPEKNARQEAKLLAAIETLDQFGYIRPINDKKTIFTVTDKGYQYYDEVLLE